MGQTTDVYAVIMAGGIGSRFWPKSREKSPKQLLEIVGEGTMIQNTVKRISDLVPAKQTYVVTTRPQKTGIAKQLPQIPAENIIVEPIGRNTAPCIGLAALFVRRLNPAGIMVVLPADHIIQDEDEFRRVLENAVSVARNSSSLVTIGIRPTRPETGYGYIQYLDDPAQSRFAGLGAFKVKTFAEKPNLAIAEKFVQSGDFLWNSGMFIWKAGVILDELRKSVPDLCDQLSNVEPSIGTALFEQNLEHAYGVIRGISIDYGVMEKADHVFVMKGDFGWSDVGSWDEVYRLTPKDKDGNVLLGKVVTNETRNSYVQSTQKLIATVGVDDIIVIETADAILVCRRGESQNVKEIVDYLRLKQMSELL